MMKISTFIRSGLLVTCGILPLTTQAVEVNFSGNLIQNPPCDVAGADGANQPIKVPFGEIGITKINGLNYQQDFTLTLTCGEGLGEAVALFLEYRGMIAESFDNKALQTSISGLGIRLYHKGVIIPPNSGTPIKMSNNGTAILPLYAIPVKNNNPTTPLLEDDFTATASVELNYP